MGEILSMENVQLLILVFNMFIGVGILLKITSLTMLFILLHCLYSGLEGIAIGVAADSEADAWTSLLNISIRLKIYVTIAIGTLLLKLLPHRPYLLSLAYLSAVFVAAPIGVAIGIHIDPATHAKVDQWVFVMTAGSFVGINVYETALTVLSNQNNIQNRSFLGGFASMLLGVGLIAVTSTLASYYYR